MLTNRKLSCGFRSLNPFENQVYFYENCGKEFSTSLVTGLNPFENQVYFYSERSSKVRAFKRLNPFENQVYFYEIRGEWVCKNCFEVLIPLRIRSISTGLPSAFSLTGGRRLNPFENQVYFYTGLSGATIGGCMTVLIPLRIRSISTPCGMLHAVCGHGS